MAYIPTSGLEHAKGRAGRSQATLASAGMKVGKVIDVDRKLHTVDLVMQSGETIRKVPVSSSVLSTRAGRSYLTKFSNQVKTTLAQKEQGNFFDDKLRSVYALVEYIQDDLGHPIVLGFMLPITNQMTFDREGFSIDRHETDQYSLTETDQQSVYDPVTDTKLSNFEWVHPSGFWVRVGRGSTHEDLTGQDTQGLARFRGTRNANTPMQQAGPDSGDYVPVTLKHPSGTGVTLTSNFDIQTGPGGQAQVNGCRILTVCDDISGASLEPVCDVLGHVLVDIYGNPVMTPHGVLV